MNKSIEEKLFIKDEQFIVNVICNFIREELEKIHFKKAVIGVSGGVDSALCAILTGMAIGGKNVICVSMPYRTSSPESVEDARLVSEIVDGDFHEINITEQIDVYFRRFSDADRIRRGNKMARERMSILYDFAHSNNALVIGTGNKSESLIGYFTRWGDGGYDINPIGDLYKTQVWQLAKFVGVPDRIIKKKPSADLWTGQTDEDEIGLSYRILDQILFCYADLRLRRDSIVKLGYDESIVDKVLSMVRKSQYKRKMGVVCKLSYRTVDKDFLYLRDWGA